ncbi:MAG: endonuclease/exonuclease/phosphatase family protein [Flavobacteriia bacterium]|nr:endonuclease/exonuclease/phosphatase family protein [Flavobacteriia bacterium]
MTKWLRKIARFTSWMKVLTVICLSSLLLAYLCPFVHPNTFWLMPFFGLAYPIIIICTLLFLIYWAFMRSKWFFIVLGVIVLGGTLHFRTLSITFSSEEATKDDNVWKIMSYNVRLFDVYNKSTEERNKNRNGIIAYIEQMNPDVVCFQEFYQQDKPTSFSTKDTLIGLMKMNYYHERYSHKMTGRQNFGICMLSKYPIVAKGDVMFNNSSNSDNYCIFADVVKNGDTLRIYNIHLQSIKLQQDDYALFGEKNKQANSEKSTFRLLIEKLRIAYPNRADQAKRVTEHMLTSPYPVVICGDFNDTPMSYVYNQFNDQLTDSYRECSTGIGVTYAGKVPAGRIDYIFHTDELSAQHFTIQEKAFSDHRAVYCEIWKSKTAKE